MTEAVRVARRWLGLWLTFEAPVGRRAYLLSGLLLAALKYPVDVLLVWQASGRLWTPLDYVRPMTLGDSKAYLGAEPLMLVLVGLWTLPFLWIAVSMSMRRALDAGISAWFVVLLFVPVVRVLGVVALAALPTSAALPLDHRHAPRPRAAEHRLPRALLAIAGGLAFGLAMIALSVYGARSYGVALFVGTPFLMGAITAFLLARRYPASFRETAEVVLLTLTLTAGTLVMVALEGALCLLMAAPIAVGAALMGAVAGRWIAVRDPGPASRAAIAVVVLPFGVLAERAPAGDAPELREVRTTIEIDAPPSAVWQAVLAFPPLPPPSELTFRLGIAYPVRARLVGTGVGAVRYCEFSTGAFVEPITAWEPGRRLAFDVAEHPTPLEEWSPYRDVAPPHLDHYFRSRRGEFRLVALPDGRTRLEGSTWYSLDIHPRGYWVLWADGLVHAIHGRVLRHVKRTAESAPTA